ncbi:CTTNBP2 N-terminal like b isoform X1 [Nerophis ophidion]|uniref:CTTNBP2 N-terminal like b isoform X1 n=2 Tax=Nerophis ophidion TaxID=159077 RepID=UPI002AE01977|nr:CTTNBP2 N-terminal like b isoform X1 [Nerophis ophidion]
MKAQHKEAFIQERYGQYDLSDPFLALQRDGNATKNQNTFAQTHAHLHEQAVGPNPLAVLKLVMAHCKRMQERMMRQLAATESRHKKMIADLVEEKQRHAHESAQRDNFSLILQTERDNLLQQLEIERASVQRLERDQDQAVRQAEESLIQQQQLSSTLTLELQRASNQAQGEAQKVSELRTLLEEETGIVNKLRGLLEEEKSKAAELKAHSERNLAEFATEQQQLKARLREEEETCKELRGQLEQLKKILGDASQEVSKKAVMQVKDLSSKMATVTTCVQTEPDGKITVPAKISVVSKVNGHHLLKETELTQEGSGADNTGLLENGGGASLHSPLQPHPHAYPHSPSSTASSSLSSSPISSPILAKRLTSPGFHQSSYQAGVNQRFQAARHKFQSQAELEQQHGGPLSPRDLSPTTSYNLGQPEHSAAKQLARNTVTQVLSRFTNQQVGAKLVPISSSPFGTDYRNLAASPTGARSPSGPLSPGIRSPITPRSEKTHAPPIPPKKPGMSPTPGSPSHSARTSLFPELTGNCGPSNNRQDESTEMDLVLSSSS